MRKIFSKNDSTKIIGFSMTETEFKHYGDLYVGLCLGCGLERDCCEPDAREYQCEHCDEFKVYGCEELLIMNKIRLDS